MYKLYARAGSGSFIVEAILAEAGVPCEIHDVERLPDRKSPDYLFKLNPMGQIPTLVLPNGEVMTESAAITIYLCDLYPKTGLAPAPDSPQRAAYLRWLLFMATTIYMSDLRAIYCERYTDDPKGAEAVKSSALTQRNRQWDILETELGNKPYLLGDRLTVLDIYAVMLAAWNKDSREFLAKRPKLRGLYERVRSRPNLAPVFKRNNMDALT
ncbi:MAG: glutathione S-transferase family protein [Rhizobiales bacterium]|nr:glutathione S-transferase family protein [Hyphomicrobiales bacterium]